MTGTQLEPTHLKQVKSQKPHYATQSRKEFTNNNPEHDKPKAAARLETQITESTKTGSL